jgi:hypothetical protein
VTTYRWNGKHGKGAMKKYREEKRKRAEARNALTEPGRRSTKRDGEPKKRRRGQRRSKQS